MSENLHTFCAWGVRFRAICQHDDGPDSITLMHDGVTLYVTADAAKLMTPAGPADLDLDAMRFAVTTGPERVCAGEVAALSSKQRWNVDRDNQSEER